MFVGRGFSHDIDTSASSGGDCKLKRQRLKPEYIRLAYVVAKATTHKRSRSNAKF
jgi:hypothetical protein